MARRHRHKNREQRVATHSSPEISVSEPEVATTGSSSHTLAELRLSLLTSGGLLILLIVASYLNVRYNWTGSTGTLLYDLLNIR